ncbi:MAG: hypothetical protein QF437_03285 [Planctomycetota bacterium]|nr:hypothetical protein [Planctomycetota bacterium]
MGEWTQKLIERLELGGSAARESLTDVEELLRKAWSPGFVPAFKHLQAEEITNEEAGRLRQALADYCQCEASASCRRTGLAILARKGEANLRDQLTRELHVLFEAHRVLNSDLSNILQALENIGEEISPKGDVMEVDAIVEAAQNYLRRRGIRVPY